MRAADCGLVLVGAGSSQRMGGIDKVWAKVAGKPLFLHSVERFLPCVAAVALVLRPDRVAAAQSLLETLPVRIVPGGSTRQESVRNGLRGLPDLDVIAVHDVARPLAATALLHEGVRLVSSSGVSGAVPAVPLADTVKRVDGEGRVLETLDRGALRAVQTPQVFKAESLIEAHAADAGRGHSATDDAALLERRGEPLVVFPGAPENFKVTSFLDLRLVEFLLESGHD